MDPDTRSQGGDVPNQLSADNNTGTPQTPQQVNTQRDAAANVIRTQISALYSPHDPRHAGHGSQKRTIQPLQQAATEEAQENVYDRTHSDHPKPTADQWKQYHTAWQQYYQKYYENYYTAEVAKSKQEKPAEKSGIFTSQPTDLEKTEETLSNDQALFELRQKLLGKVQDSAKKIRKSRHFVPIVAALSVVLVFVFLQYNSVIFANVKAYITPGNIDPQNIVVDPTAQVAVGPESRLIIPKINVDVPVFYDISTDHDSQMAAMENGLAHFPIRGASSHPGEVGNTVIAGHSSNDLFDTGQYKFIFAQLEKLKEGDTIYANYNGVRYTYVVTKMEVVHPTQVDKLVYPTDKPVMTLITCTPLGTALNRLLVTAEQVSPSPTDAAPAPAENSDEGDAEMPGNSPTVLERLFG